METSMLTVGHVMTEGVVCVDADDSTAGAARLMRDTGLGSLPIRGPDGRLQGLVTYRDIVVRCLARGHDARICPVSHLAGGEAVSVRVGDPIEVALQTMAAVRTGQLPVLDRGRLVGLVSLADIAKVAPDDLSSPAPYVESRH
jgi:CBS domain-containing protein